MCRGRRDGTFFLAVASQEKKVGPTSLGGIFVVVLVLPGMGKLREHAELAPSFTRS